MATEKVINMLATVLLLCLCALNQMSVTALAIEKPNEQQTSSTDSDHTSYNASESVVPANNPNDTSQTESSKVVIDYDLPKAQQSDQKDDGTTPVLKLIINQSDSISANTSQPVLTESSGTLRQADNASEKEATASAHQPLIPPASVTASIAQMPSSGSTSKQQGQIIIR